MTAFPQRRRRVASIAAAVLVLAGLVTVPSLTANAATPLADAPSFSIQQLRQHVSRVQQWSDDHQAPYRAAAHLTQQQFLDYSTKLADYWEQLPWSDFYGQYGCTVDSVDVQFHETDGEWGAAGASNTVVYSCDDDAALSAVTPEVPSEATPPTAATADAAGLPVATQALAADGSINLAGTIGGADTCAESGSHHLVCVGVPYAGTLIGSETNLSGHTDTGHLRLGNVGLGGTCGAGTVVATGSTVSIPNNAYLSLSHSVNVTSKWSSRWYDPNETSQVCGTY